MDADKNIILDARWMKLQSKKTRKNGVCYLDPLSVVTSMCLCQTCILRQVVARARAHRCRQIHTQQASLGERHSDASSEKRPAGRTHCTVGANSSALIKQTRLSGLKIPSFLAQWGAHWWWWIERCKCMPMIRKNQATRTHTDIERLDVERVVPYVLCKARFGWRTLLLLCWLCPCKHAA